MKNGALCLLLIFLRSGFTYAQPIGIWLHAHNDYEKDNPLKEALKHAFNSIEVDIFLHHGRIVVSHIPWRLNFKPYLEELYFKPLAQLHDQNFWSQYSARPLRLMIDMKNASVTAVDSLRALVGRYHEIFVGPHAPVRLVLSGGADRSLLKPGDTVFWGLDDSVVALWEKGLIPDAYTAQASMSWPAFRKRYLQYRSLGQQDSLVHQITTWFKERKIPLRLYAAGNRTRRWKRLADWGFTLINVDRYKRGRRWLDRYRQIRQYKFQDR